MSTVTTIIKSIFAVHLDQFVKANLNIWNNNWRTVYDYTWNEGDNWTVNEEPVIVELSDQLNK